MQVILLEKVANLGNLGDVVRVKDGYARNFLIPQRKARRATETAIADFEADDLCCFSFLVNNCCSSRFCLLFFFYSIS